MTDFNGCSFQRTYQLKAQTPLIHFQYAQSGATLRATEVKPKLDRFLWNCAKDRIENKWRVTESKAALNYKMHIAIQGTPRIVDLGMKTDYDIFYGNTGVEEDKKKKGVIGDVTITIICTIPELLKLIDEYLATFFVVTNFGSMQNKGFGSFTVVGKPCSANMIAQSLKNTYGAQKCYSFAAGVAPFTAIKMVYGMMKSGVNYTEFRGAEAYQRSLLFLFMHNQKQKGNEKAWLKQKGFAPTNVGKNSGKWHRNEQHPAYYVRALLGIGDHIDFLNDLSNKKDKTTITIANADKEKIERFSSPIFFKVIDGNVYFVGKRIEKEIFGATFTFTSPKGSGTLTVPTEEALGEDFVDEFLNYCVTELNKGALKKFREVKDLRIVEVR